MPNVECRMSKGNGKSFLYLAPSCSLLSISKGARQTRCAQRSNNRLMIVKSSPGPALIQPSGPRGAPMKPQLSVAV